MNLYQMLIKVLKKKFKLDLKDFKSIKNYNNYRYHDSYEAFYLGSKCGIILNQKLKQFDDLKSLSFSKFN